MKILVACEESQAVTIELRRFGHEAYSCDLEVCSGGHPEWHLQTDARELLKMHWDMILAFPPCTYLTAAGAVRLFDKNGRIKDMERFEKGIKAAEFFRLFLENDCPKVAVENPVPLKCFELPPYSQIIEPFWFGEPWRKRTCLWLKGLDMLKPTNIVTPRGLWIGTTSARKDSAIYSKYELHPNRDSKRRSKTFLGVARAMADQWVGRKDL